MLLFTRKFACTADVDLLKQNLLSIVLWTKTWLLHLDPNKWQNIALSNKDSPPIPCYCIDTKLVSCKTVVHYRGIFVHSHLNWNDLCKHVAAKATWSLNFLHRCWFHCSSVVKSIAYKCIVWITMEYACPVWHPHTVKNIKHVAAGSRWNPYSYCWSRSSDDCVQELNWPSIQKIIIIYFSICQLYDILHHRNPISFPNHFSYPEILKNHILAFIKTASLSINSY